MSLCLAHCLLPGQQLVPQLGEPHLRSSIQLCIASSGLHGLLVHLTPGPAACSEDEMAAELAEVKCMWEMAATLDFLNLFRSVGGGEWVAAAVVVTSHHAECPSMLLRCLTLCRLSAAAACRRQLQISRQFHASELEHVLAYSDGRDGLLADLHIVSGWGGVKAGSWCSHSM